MSKILGYLWIFLGIICAAKPDFFRGWLARRNDWKIFWFILFLFIFIFLQLLGIVFRFKGDLPKVAGVIGVLFLLKIAWDVQAKARGKLAARFGELPLFPFQAFGWFLIAMGISLVYLGHFPYTGAGPK